MQYMHVLYFHAGWDRMEITMKTISGQSFRDDAIVEAKRAAKDYTVTVSPVFDHGGETIRVVLDGHHAHTAAILDGVSPEYVTATERDNDSVALIGRGEIEDFLQIARIDCDYYDIATGGDVW